MLILSGTLLRPGSNTYYNLYTISYDSTNNILSSSTQDIGLEGGAYATLSNVIMI
jgi:hypothetical protein